MTIATGTEGNECCKSKWVDKSDFGFRQNTFQRNKLRTVSISFMSMKGAKLHYLKNQVSSVSVNYSISPNSRNPNFDPNQQNRYPENFASVDDHIFTPMTANHKKISATDLVNSKEERRSNPGFTSKIGALNSLEDEKENFLSFSG